MTEPTRVLAELPRVLVELPLLGDGPAGRLRAYQPGDLADLGAAFADPEIGLWNPGSDDIEAQKDFMARRNDWSDGEHCSWAVADASDRLVGSVSLFKFVPDQGEAEIGYFTAPWARRQGYAVRAVRTATAYVFDELRGHRIHLFHGVENVGSCGVAVRAGFQLEGNLRQSYRYPDGRYHDEHLHALLASDPRE